MRGAPRPLRGVGALGGASPRRGRGVEAASSLPLRCVEGASQRRGRGVGAASLRRGICVGGASPRRGSGVGAASLLRERGISTARERRHRGRYAAWEACHRGMGAAWERRHRGCYAACKARHRGVGGAWEGRHCGVRGLSARRWSGVIAGATLRGRRVTAAWNGVIYPDFSLNLTGFFSGKHLIQFLGNKTQDFRDFILHNCNLKFHAEQFYLKLQVTNVKNKKVTANPAPQTL